MKPTLNWLGWQRYCMHYEYQRRMRLLWIVFIILMASILFGPRLAHAQTVVTTGPVTTSHKAVWDIGNLPSAAAAQALVPRFRIDGATTPIEPTGTTCVAVTPAQPNTWTCSVNLNAQMVTLLNFTGSHSVVLREYDPATMMEGPDSIPFVLQSPPAAPSGLRITN